MNKIVYEFRNGLYYRYEVLHSIGRTTMLYDKRKDQVFRIKHCIKKYHTVNRTADRVIHCEVKYRSGYMIKRKWWKRWEWITLTDEFKEVIYNNQLS